jgi:hypothetical protein
MSKQVHPPRGNAIDPAAPVGCVQLRTLRGRYEERFRSPGTFCEWMPYVALIEFDPFARIHDR